MHTCTHIHINKILVGKLKGSHHLGYVHDNRDIILKYVCKKTNVGQVQVTRTGSNGLCTHSKTPSGAIKCWQVIGQLDDYKLLNILYVRHWGRLTVLKKK